MRQAKAEAAKAVHEVGHLYLHQVLGLGEMQVSLASEGDYSSTISASLPSWVGHGFEPSTGGTNSQRLWGERQILALAGGMAAERLILGRVEPHLKRIDTLELGKIAIALYASDLLYSDVDFMVLLRHKRWKRIEQRLAAFERQAAEMVSTPKGAICIRIAARLLSTQGVLSTDDVAMLLGQN